MPFPEALSSAVSPEGNGGIGAGWVCCLIYTVSTPGGAEVETIYLQLEMQWPV